MARELSYIPCRYTYIYTGILLKYYSMHAAEVFGIAGAVPNYFSAYHHHVNVYIIEVEHT